MPDAATSYRIWQSPESVLIQHGSGSIEMSIADALALAADITARLAPPTRVRAERDRRAQWTPELSAECVRLYTIERLGCVRIGKRLGISATAAVKWLTRAGVSIRPSKTNNVALARAALAAKRAQAA